MSAFPNDAAPIVVLGAATGSRADAFQAALTRFGRAPAALFSFDRFLSQPDVFEAALRPGGALRFDSPDRERAGLVALYRLGAETAAERGYAVLEGGTLEA